MGRQEPRWLHPFWLPKRALCIGINDYPGTGSDLSGCVNDAKDWAGMLTGRGFEVTTMLDKDATKAKIASAMTEVVKGAGYGDLAVITYSGHGTLGARSGRRRGRPARRGALPL